MSRPLPKHLASATVLAFALLGAAAATAGELPAYEVSSFPASSVQLSILGASRAQQQPAVATLTRADMPASPHQLAVLAQHHHRSASADAAATTGSALK